ncbi:hypothetical protein GOBAR_DD22015 [Gossypium barbadense]|nr:hypothetical protein GOBAR_DD22015 [Gossypium barbadense]
MQNANARHNAKAKGTENYNDESYAITLTPSIPRREALMEAGGVSNVARQATNEGEMIDRRKCDKGQTRENYMQDRRGEGRVADGRVQSREFRKGKPDVMMSIARFEKGLEK